MNDTNLFYLFNIFYKYLKEINIKDDHIIKIKLDDVEFMELRNIKALYNFIKEKITDADKYFVLIDEVQKCDNFEEVLNSLLNIENVDTYVTGINSKFLSSDIITEFRGRSLQIHVMPLSFSEFLPCYEGTKEEAFNEYMLHDGMPLTLAFINANSKEEYIKDLFDLIYKKDVIDRYKIKDLTEFKELVSIIATQVGSLTNINKISNTFNSVYKNKKMTPYMVDKYLDYLKDSFIIAEVNRYDIKGQKSICATRKYYFQDIGVRNSILNFNDTNYGFKMENILYNELIFKGFNVEVGVVEEVIKENDKSKRKDYEVDFIATCGSKRYYIQSAYGLYSKDKLNQKSKSLLRINDSFKKIIIVNEPIKVRHDENGITIIGLLEFFTNPYALEQ